MEQLVSVFFLFSFNGMNTINGRISNESKENNHFNKDKDFIMYVMYMHMSLFHENQIINSSFVDS